jgi:hypothetical protein
MTKLTVAFRNSANAPKNTQMVVGCVLFSDTVNIWIKKRLWQTNEYEQGAKVECWQRKSEAYSKRNSRAVGVEINVQGEKSVFQVASSGTGCHVAR